MLLILLAKLYTNCKHHPIPNDIIKLSNTTNIGETSGMDKRFLGILVVIFLGFSFLIFGKDSAKTDLNSNGAQPTLNTRGLGTKKVEFVEYGDFQCPVCSAWYPIIKQVEEKYGDQVKFQYRNFPLDQIHSNARAAHRAGVAAGNQGKFWEMHDKLYENQNSWNTQTNIAPVLEAYAKELGLDMTKYTTDWGSSATNSIINADIKEGQKFKITGTPGFVINGKLIENPTRSLESLSKIIDEAIATSNPTPTATESTPKPAITTPVAQ
jgi:protein-disulfide isomerase